MGRRFLFLQGVATPFFSRLGDWLLRRGEQVFRVNLCAGDALYWRGKPAWNFRGAGEGFPDWLEERITRHAITDIVLFGDRRPLHRAAILLARELGVRVHAFEEGYIRPNWITLERGGVNAGSALPRDPAWYRAADRLLEAAGEGERVPAPIAPRAGHDMAYHAANLLNYVAYPGYRTHRPRLSAVEYAGWALRYARFPWRAKRDAAQLERILGKGRPFYFLPLQLNSDAQIVHHSPFGNMARAVKRVLTSFAEHAHVGTHLIIKNHPFDTGLAGYARFIRRLSFDLGIAHRVLYVQTGALPVLLENALGVIVVNSTVGFSALQHARPTIALGKAIYDLPGLTFQGNLDDFWSDLTPPDFGLVRAFRNVVIHATQVNGGFYSGLGIATALEGCGRLLEPLSRLEGLMHTVSLRSALTGTRSKRPFAVVPANASASTGLAA
jgi:capsular polysaccharide export protein